MLRISQLILISLISSGCSFQADSTKKETSENRTHTQASTRVNLDPYTSDKLNAILKQRPKIAHDATGRMTDAISADFLGTPYRGNMLKGSANSPEELVIDFRGLDCFTYLDYVEALRKSTSAAEFVNNLIQTRYIDGHISFFNRKHFFTDWAYREHKLADDITAQISPNAVTSVKYLNKKADGGNYLPGLAIVERNITYIPAKFIDENVVNRLRTGDLIGIYTHLAGLDVTHVGFFIMTDNGPVLRNASSRKENEKVVDSPFIDYVKEKPGIIVLRPLS